MGVKWLLNLLDFGNSGGGLADRGGHIAMVGINTFVLEYFDFDVHTVWKVSLKSLTRKKKILYMMEFM